ncbi:transcriptional regulator, LysR family protein (plasmid) [Rhodococcus jostii RHA1]|uniref:Transcriptional regulator, LysR family protein n=1 Tax=Rhodococcus jostii (strain RHA1) TaxID=101510 RepID=Q0RXH6_RHOJR|nr:LysR substrate-binding domain-containing protein [Rhodococcus jostii]ABH00010.1 transcriptional regulator, LysR family protein [Rhodococcus jostii RHA1]
MEIRHLKYFLAVAEHLHYGRAAKSLNMAQPPLSQQIRRLEKILQMELFDRSSRRVTLTNEGQFLLEAAREVVGQSDHFENLAKALRMGEAGQLRIGFAASAMNWGLGTKLRQFRTAYPEADVIAHQMSVADQATALQDDRIDLAFTVGGLNYENLQVVDLDEEPLRAVIPSDHPLAGMETVRLADLSHETFVGYRFDDHLEDIIASACYRAGFTPKISFQGAQSHTLLHMVSAGFGLGLLPACDARMGADGVVFIDLEPPVPTMRISVVRHWRRLTPLAERMLELVKPKE